MFPHHANQDQIGHRIYADNIHLIIQDNHEDIAFFLDLFDRFSDVSGLRCDWGRTQAIYLADQDLPERLMALGWTWEDEFTTTKLLGVHIADELVPRLMTK